ncbi:MULTISPECIES: hypothetical protein [unclassified Arthrobacter]|uniref:hypothetical protein n=1 Tax=unclassified Arthrobacter TaxID=235627 RepID=UPI0033946028
MLKEALVFQPLEEGIQRSALNADETVMPQDLGDGVAMVFALAEHPEHCLLKRSPGQLLVKLDIIHN